MGREIDQMISAGKSFHGGDDVHSEIRGKEKEPLEESGGSYLLTH